MYYRNCTNYQMDAPFYIYYLTYNTLYLYFSNIVFDVARVHVSLEHSDLNINPIRWNYVGESVCVVSKVQ